MSDSTDKKFEFRDWMKTQQLKSAAVTSRFGISDQTVRHWRSKGVPESRQDFVSRTIAEWANGARSGMKLVVNASEEQFAAWNRASIDCKDGPKTIEQWASEGLDELAREYFENPQLSLPLRSLDKVADEKHPDAPPSLGQTRYPRRGKGK